MKKPGRSILAGFLACLSLASADVAPGVAQENNPGRARSGLLALYDFSSTSGPVIKDRSGVGAPVDLRIADPKTVRRAAGSLEVRAKGAISSAKPATKIIDSIKRSGEITVEAWIQPANVSQNGPARIVTLSNSPNERNFTLGQEGNRFDARLRTTGTSTNGIPSTETPARSASTKRTHVVYTRERSGRARVYVNGKQVAQKAIPGAATNWNGSMKLGLANEQSGDRPWLGKFYLVAIYSRSLASREVQQNFAAGASASAGPALAKQINTERFETQVAPLLAKHCVECHDPATKKGGLVLSKKGEALAGGESGKAIVPGKSVDSLLWDMVESNEMPKERPPLSSAEKALLRKWIDAGAEWSLAVIDPAVYTHEGRAGKTWVQRLTIAEYIETVRTAVGVDISKEARELLPPDLRADGFSNTAYNLNVDLKHVDAYAKLAAIIVSRMDVDAFAKRYSRSRRLIDDDNRNLIAKMGRWLLRGPLDEREIVSYRGIATTVASGGGSFTDATGYILEAMLQSPRFIYRIENQRGDGTAWPVNEYELASRLSYIIWGGPPDEELLKAADDGKLDRSGTAGQVERMLKDPRAKQKSAQFISEWLNLGRLDTLKPSRERFPNWDPQLAADMRNETLLFFEDVVWKQNRPLSDLLNSQVTFATPRLARHYGLKPQNGPADSPVRYDLKSSASRGGLLTQGSILTVGGNEASMISRGLFVLHDLLRGVVKDPPPGVDATPVPTKAGLTQRGIAESRIANVSCGGCHGKFEPLAFALEKFDGLGTFHDADRHGNKLRDDGSILIPGAAKPTAYKSSAELMDLLAGSDRIRETITWKVTQFSLGRPLVAADAPILARIHSAAQEGGGTWPSLIKAIVMSDLVQFTRTEDDSGQ